MNQLGLSDLDNDNRKKLRGLAKLEELWESRRLNSRGSGGNQSKREEATTEENVMDQVVPSVPCPCWRCKEMDRFM
jgi:hypothetical protein